MAALRAAQELSCARHMANVAKGQNVYGTRCVPDGRHVMQPQHERRICLISAEFTPKLPQTLCKLPSMQLHEHRTKRSLSFPHKLIYHHRKARLGRAHEGARTDIDEQLG